jgi:hypothetical protein
MNIFKRHRSRIHTRYFYLYTEREGFETNLLLFPKVHEFRQAAGLFPRCTNFAKLLAEFMFPRILDQIPTMVLCPLT